MFKPLLKSLYAKARNPFPQDLPMAHEKIITLLAKSLKPKVYVELGLYECRLFNQMIPLVSENLYGVDTNRNAGTYMKNSPKTHFKAMTTDAFAAELKINPIIIDVLFIDANHSYESVISDFKNYFPYVRQDGIIFMHDGYPKNEVYAAPEYCGDGYRAIFELSKHTSEYEMVTIPVEPGLTICRKRIKQVPWQE